MLPMIRILLASEDAAWEPDSQRFYCNPYQACGRKKGNREERAQSHMYTRSLPLGEQSSLYISVLEQGITDSGEEMIGGT